MRPAESTKEAYNSPEMTPINLESQSPILDVSKPGGTTNPLDPNEG